MDLPHRIERRFRLPVEHIVGQAVEEQITPEPIEGPVRVLLVEDQPADIALTRQAFENDDHEVDIRVAKNGAEALDALRTYGPESVDMILLDLKMPVLDGHEFLDQVGQEFELDKLNVVVLTTSSSDSDRERAHALGAGAYIIKDPDFEVFQNSLASVVGEVATGR
jgi:CheY-like chemotaxis protein